MAGELVIRKGGYLGIEDDDNADDGEQGAGQVFTDKPEECCCCDPCENADPKPHKILHAWTSNSNNPPENLRPYKKKGECFKYWKLAEGEMRFNDEGCYTGSSGSGYESGTIENGELIGLPDEWRSGYSYDGAMKLVLACCYVELNITALMLSSGIC